MFSLSVLSGISRWLQVARVIRAGGQHPSPEPRLTEPQRCRTRAARAAAKSSQEHKLLWSKKSIIFTSAVLRRTIKPVGFVFLFPFLPATNIIKNRPPRQTNQPGCICRVWWIEETHKIRVFTNLLGLLLLLLSSRKLLYYFCRCSGSTGKSHFSTTVLFYFPVWSLWFQAVGI